MIIEQHFDTYCISFHWKISPSVNIFMTIQIDLLLISKKIFYSLYHSKILQKISLPIFESMLKTIGSFDQFCFQIKLYRLTSSTPVHFSFRASVLKGNTSSSIHYCFPPISFTGLAPIEESKESFTIQGTSCDLGGAPMGFNLPNYNPKRPVEFTVQLADLEKNQVIGSFPLDSSQFIEDFKESQTTYFQRSAAFGVGLNIKYVLFIEKSRIGLINSIKQIESDKKFGEADPPIQQTKSTSSPTRRTLVRKNESSTPAKEDPYRKMGSQQEDDKSATSETPSRSGKVPIRRTRDKEADKTSREPTPVDRRDSGNGFTGRTAPASVIVEPTGTTSEILQRSEVKSYRTASISNSASIKKPAAIPVPVQRQNRPVTPTKEKIPTTERTPTKEKTPTKLTSSKVSETAEKKTQSKKEVKKQESEAVGGVQELMQNKNFKIGALVALAIVVLGFMLPKLFGSSKVSKKHKKVKRRSGL